MPPYMMAYMMPNESYFENNCMDSNHAELAVVASFHATVSKHQNMKSLFP